MTTLNSGLLDEAVRRIVERVHPSAIVLFGSAARDELGPHSDLDFLIIMPDGSECREIAKVLYRQLRGLDMAKDLVVVQESDVNRHRDNPYLVIHTALSEGKEIYRAGS